MKAFLILVSIIFISFSCYNDAKERSIIKPKTGEVYFSDLAQIQPDSTLFYFKHLSRTINEGDFSSFSKMNNLDSNQLRTWLQPILKDIKIPPDYKKSGGAVKMLSFQKETKSYTSIIIAVAFDEVQQFFVTISSCGRVIDGLKVSYIKNLSNSEIEYNKERSVYKFSTRVISCFEGDSIIVYSIEDVSKIENPHESKDTWQEVYETKYVVNHDGIIQLISKRKQADNSKLGDLQK